MEKIIKKADVYLKIDNDSVCYTIDFSQYETVEMILDVISGKINELLRYKQNSDIKLESIYFREEKINGDN